MNTPGNASWFKWQDRKSVDFGVLMTSLPTITFPGQRYTSYETNGIDGSIIQRLGYQSYELSFTIALANTLDRTDENVRASLMGLFYIPNSQKVHGNLVFSKDITYNTTGANIYVPYYKATLLSQIDFDRLVKYKTATLTFLCQPLRYMAYYDDTTGTFDYDITYTHTALSGWDNLWNFQDYYCTKQIGMKRQPKVELSLASTFISSLSSYKCFGVWIAANPTNATHQDEDTVVSDRRAYMFNCTKIKALIDSVTYTSINECIIQIDPTTNDYNLYLYVTQSSGSTYKTNFDVSACLMLSNEYAAGTATLPDRYRYWDKHNWQVLSLSKRTNFAVPLGFGRSSSAGVDRIVVYVINSNNASLADVQVGEVYYHPRETVL